MHQAVIKIEGLNKEYRLGVINRGSLHADIQSKIAKKLGKQDPNASLDEYLSDDRGTFLALNNINLEINRGEAVGIIGSNGAGKSTLLKVLTRVTAPSSGKIYVKGRIGGMLEVGTGFHPELTGRENIYMNGAILGMTKKEIDSKINDIIDFSECGRFIDTPVKRYSSGMYVKLAFSVAAFLDSDILVMDEVLAVGDMKFQEKCLGKMGDAAGTENKTVLYVSHNMNTIRQLCTRCIVLNRGSIVYDGAVDRAIDIYLGNLDYELKNFLDFSKSKRPSIEHGKKLFIKSLEFLGYSQSSFYNTDVVSMQFCWKAFEAITNVRIMAIVYRLDDVVVGTFESDRICDAMPGCEYNTVVKIPFDRLRDGQYYMYVHLISLNEYNTHHGYDMPLEKVYFQIMLPEHYNGIVWDKHFLGNVRLGVLVEDD